MAACFIHKGFEVIGVDKNQDFVDALGYEFKKQARNDVSIIFPPYGMVWISVCFVRLLLVFFVVCWFSLIFVVVH